MLINLPNHWEYEIENGDLQACFDPQSQSTLRIHILTATNSQVSTERDTDDLTDHQPYVITSKGYLLIHPTYFETVERGKNITLITWRLINNRSAQKLIALLNYTVLTAEIKSEQEKQTISLIEKSLRDADLA